MMLELEVVVVLMLLFRLRGPRFIDLWVARERHVAPDDFSVGVTLKW